MEDMDNNAAHEDPDLDLAPDLAVAAPSRWVVEAVSFEPPQERAEQHPDLHYDMGHGEQQNDSMQQQLLPMPFRPRTPLDDVADSSDSSHDDGNDNDNDNDDGDNHHQRVPSTPPRAAAAATTGRAHLTNTTPLTPLSMDDDGDDDNDDNHMDNNDPEGQHGGGSRPPAAVAPAMTGEGTATATRAAAPLLQDDDIVLIRGTDVHVPTAAGAFTDFLRHFCSLQHSRRQVRQRMQRQSSSLANRRRTDHPDDMDTTHGDDNDDVDDSDSDSDSDADDEAVTPPLYLSKLQALLTQEAAPVDTNLTAIATDPTSSWMTTSLDIDTIHLYFHSPACRRFYHQLVAYPMELVPLMDILVQRQLEQLAQQLYPEDYDERTIPRVQVRPYNLKDVSNLRCLDPVAMDSLVSIRGMIVRSSPIIPDLKVAYFSCFLCGHNVQVTIDRGRIAEPSQRCPQCNTSCYQLVHNRSVFADKQLVRIQETPDEVPAGQTPASVVTFCFDDLVDAVQPGDKVEVTGVLRAQPVRVHPRVTKVKSIYKTYLDVIHFRKITGMEWNKDLNQLAADGDNNQDSPNQDEVLRQQEEKSQGNRRGKQAWTAERIRQLEQLSQRPDIYEQLTASLAPSIWELDDIKKGILCMLFGGNHLRVQRGRRHRRRRRRSARTATRQQQQQQNRHQQHDGDDAMGDHGVSSSMIDDNGSDDDNDEDSSAAEATTDNTTIKLHKRGDINILLVGDPGTSKSQLLSYVNKLSSRGVYTSGKGSSAVGLTASVVRDPETRDLVLESGALVLSDLGICCIDEFDKMSDTTRSVLHEAMEQQTVSIAKAGIIATLHARTSVLASANPIESRYNPSMSVVDNIQLSPTLLSRFDLIYLILDTPQVDHDRRLAQHLVGLYYETPNVVEPPLDQALLRDYIEYAREHIHPEISDEAADHLIDSYLEMRNPGGGNYNAAQGTRTISATPRQLESLIRISEALAKMRYRWTVTLADTQEAVRLMRIATQTAATDPRTGRIDMDMITTGRSTVAREMQDQIQTTLLALLAERRGRRMTVREVTQQVSEILTATSTMTTNTTAAAGGGGGGAYGGNSNRIPPELLSEALHRLEADGVIQYQERAQTILVRQPMTR